MTTDDAGIPVRTEHYTMKSNLKTRQYEDRSIPKYITPDQFARLYKLALKKKDLCAVVIMRLGYGYGLRLGEILGLTLEDITEVSIDKKITPVLYIRNRLSDKIISLRRIFSIQPMSGSIVRKIIGMLGTVLSLLMTCMKSFLIM